MSDQEAIQGQQQLLRTYRKTLAILLDQKAIQTSAFVPPGVIHGIDEARDNIRTIKQQLRDSGVVVEDVPGDEETAAPRVDRTRTRPFRPEHKPRLLLPPVACELGTLRLYLTHDGASWVAEAENLGDLEVTQVNLRLRPQAGGFINPNTASVSRLAGGERRPAGKLSLGGRAGQPMTIQVSASYWIDGKAQSERADNTLDITLT